MKSTSCCLNVKDIATGWVRLALGQRNELAASRMVFCAPCEFNEGGKCMKCPTKIKCRVKAKTRVEGVYCPVGKWGAV